MTVCAWGAVYRTLRVWFPCHIGKPRQCRFLKLHHCADRKTISAEVRVYKVINVLLRFSGSLDLGPFSIVVITKDTFRRDFNTPYKVVILTSGDKKQFDLISRQRRATHVLSDRY